jgi:RNA polymerase sigma-70 factor (ECF subfamily)
VPSPNTHPKDSHESAPEPEPTSDPLHTIAPDSYPDLRKSADKLLRRERRSHTLSPTALVNEAFLRLARQRKRVWDSPEGFLAAATGMMKRILTNYGRDRNALKRGGGRGRVPLDESTIPESRGGSTTNAVRDALERLRARDARAAEIAEMRLYRGLGNDIIAETLGLSLRTVEREWATARAWLRAELAEEDST